MQHTHLLLPALRCQSRSTAAVTVAPVTIISKVNVKIRFRHLKIGNILIIQGSTDFTN